MAMTKSNFYDADPKYNYRKYWQGREYENAAEERAIKTLLKGQHFKKSADIGGGFGRLCLLLQHYSDKVTLVEPSKKQRELGKDFLEGSSVDIKNGDSVKTGLSAGSVDLITMIRVMHHLPNPTPSFTELHRVLSNDGRVILEVANSKNFKSRIRRGLKGKKTPHAPVDIRTDSHTEVDLESPFVNHNPATIKKQLHEAGFEIVKTLSVSNFRSPTIKRILPSRALHALEVSSQRALSPLHFGPSIFFYLRKIS